MFELNPRGGGRRGGGGRPGRGGRGRYPGRGYRRAYYTYPYYSYPWWYYTYPYGYGYNYGYNYAQPQGVASTCCYSPSSGTLYCPSNLALNGKAAASLATREQGGNTLSLVSSPALANDTWMWHCAP